MLNIVDMILSWKILWFQRVSEHVLELGHYEVKESKVCIINFDCLKKKKHILYILSFSILMKVYLYCFFPPIDWFTRSLDEEFIDVISCCVFAWRKWEIAFVIKLKLFHSEDVWAWICKRVNISTHSLTSCHSVYSIALFVEHFFCVGVTLLQAGLVQPRIHHFLHSYSIGAISQIFWTTRITNMISIKNDTMI